MMLLYCSEGYEIDRLIRNVIFLNELLPVTEIKTTFNELINYYLSEGSSFIDLFISYFFFTSRPVRAFRLRCGADSRPQPVLTRIYMFLVVLLESSC